MKNIFWKNALTALAALMLPAPAFAGLFQPQHGYLTDPCSAAVSACDPIVSACDPTCSPTPTCDAYAAAACSSNTKSLWNYGGWIETGGYVNAYGQDNRYLPNGGGFDPASGNGQILYNVDHNSYFQLNQAWAYLEKQLSGQGFDIGGRIDLAYGTDARFLEMSGLELNSNGDHWGGSDYSLAVAQLYAEIGLDKLSLKVGKFLSPLGYESIQSPDRFFYSMSNVFAHPPTTLNGAVLSYQVSDNFSVYNAWGNTSFFNDSRNNAYVGGFNWQIAPRLGLGYGVILGSNAHKNSNDPTTQYFIQSVVANLQLTDRWNYVFEWTLENDKDGNHSGYYGINQELFYKLNNHWNIGARYEWLHFYNSSRYANVIDTDSINSLTLGLNWKPTNYFTLKPEIRYDNAKDSTPFNDGLKGHQLSFGLSGVVVF
ncbi:MAG: porin [Planctomycetaceae bacterium]|jgi:hypothetical protein|nr:porin [Planctomycetaceae bacterium]